MFKMYISHDWYKISWYQQQTSWLFHFKVVNLKYSLLYSLVTRHF